MGNSDGLEQNKRESPQPYLLKITIIGFLGGLLWNLVAYFTFYFHFTEVGPGSVLLFLGFGDWKERVVGQLVGVFILSVVSIGVSLVYHFLFKKILGVIPGVIYGLVMWSAVFGLLPLFMSTFHSIKELRNESIVTSICLFILYGVFIAYSVSFEAKEQHNTNYSNKS